MKIASCVLFHLLVGVALAAAAGNNNYVLSSPLGSLSTNKVLSLDERLANALSDKLTAWQPSSFQKRDGSSSLGDDARIQQMLNKLAALSSRIKPLTAVISPQAIEPRTGQQQQPQSPTTTSALDSARAAASKLAISKLMRKADWNSLAVKLAKVFVQYFLDLILTEMFGTTGELFVVVFWL